MVRNVARGSRPAGRFRHSWPDSGDHTRRPVELASRGVGGRVGL